MPNPQSSPPAHHSFSKRIADFCALARAGRVPNLRTGGTRKVSKAEVEPIVSVVRQAIAWETGTPVGADPTVSAAMLTELPSIAARRAQAEEREAPQRHAAMARVFATALLAGNGGPAHRPLGSPALVPIDPDTVPDGWRSLYDALDAYVHREQRWRSTRSGLRDFACLAVERGCAEPRPDLTREDVDQWFEAAGISSKRAHHLLTSYRKAREVSGRSELPDLLKTVREDSRGLSGLAALPSELRSLDTIEQVRAICPDVAAARDEWVVEYRPAAATTSNMDRTLSWMVAELWRAGWSRERLRDLSIIDPLTITRPVETVTSVAVSARQRRMKGKVGGGSISLLEALVERAAAASHARSPLWIVQDGETAPAEVYRYTQRLVGDVCAIRLLAHRFLGSAMERSESEEDRQTWERANAAAEALLRRMRRHNERLRAPEGRKDKGKLPLAWTDLVFLGLPALRKDVLKARACMEAFHQRYARLDSRKGTTLVREYHTMLRRYSVFAIIVADAMRISNYTGGRAGSGPRSHFQPRFRRDAHGRPTGLIGVRVAFRRNDESLVELKKKDRADTGDRDRVHDLEPGLVDFDLLWAYWTEARPTALVARGLLGSTAEYDVERDGFAMFVAPNQGRQRHLNPTGRFTPDSLGRIFGETLHWVCVEVLRLNEREGLLPEETIPSWEELQRYSKFKETDPATYQRLARWRALFAPHIVRLLYNTYWHGVRQNSSQAAKVTDATTRTLTAHYLVYADDLAARLQLSGPRNPRWFDAVVDRIMGPPQAGDDWAAFWRRFDPNDLEAALERLTASTLRLRPSRTRAASRAGRALPSTATASER